MEPTASDPSDTEASVMGGESVYDTQSLDLGGHVEYLSSCWKTDDDGGGTGSSNSRKVVNQAISFQYRLWIALNETGDSMSTSNDTVSGTMAATTMVHEIEVDLHRSTADYFLICNSQSSWTRFGFDVRALSSADRDVLTGPCPSQRQKEVESPMQVGDATSYCFMAMARLRMEVILSESDSGRSGQPTESASASTSSTAPASGSMDDTLATTLTEFYKNLLDEQPWDHPGLVQLQFDGWTNNHRAETNSTTEAPVDSSFWKQPQVPWITCAVAVVLVLVGVMTVVIRRRRRASSAQKSWVVMQAEYSNVRTYEGSWPRRKKRTLPNHNVVLPSEHDWGFSLRSFLPSSWRGPSPVLPPREPRLKLHHLVPPFDQRPDVLPQASLYNQCCKYRVEEIEEL